MSQLNLPLSGIKVVELGTHVGVPNATRLMADMGAEVIKIEGLKGDQWRVVGRNQMCPVTDEENPFFVTQNANKQFTAINLKNEKGMEVMHRLLSGADVFVTNVRLGSLKKMGLDYDALRQKYPKLVFAHFNGYGYEGPEAWKPGFDSVAFWARSGAMVDWNDIGDYPFLPPAGTGDATCAAQLCAGILSALIGRERTGSGTFVSVSLLGTITWYCASGMISAQYGNEYPKAKDRPGTPFGCCYICSDGEWIMIGVADYNGTYPRLMEAIGLGDYVDDVRYNTSPEVRKNLDTFMPLIRGAFTKKTRDEWIEILSNLNIVCGKIGHMKELASDPQCLANGFVRDVTFATGHTIKMPMPPVQFHATYDKPDYKLSGGVGKDTDAIMHKLGYTEEEIRHMKEDEAIG